MECWNSGILGYSPRTGREAYGLEAARGANPQTIKTSWMEAVPERKLEQWENYYNNPNQNLKWKISF